MRTGLIAKKIGMTRLYMADGTHVPVTVLSLKDCQVIATQTEAKNGYNSVTLGTGEAKLKNTNKAQKEVYAKIKVAPKMKQKEFRVSESNMIGIGSELSANHFMVGQFVDVTGVTIGKGFAGAMKRHNFGGLRASHGVSISDRSHGSTGNSQDPGRVFKGKKMAGHMGDRQRTVQNLQVIAVDEDRGLIFIKGGLPGSKGKWISIKDSVKKAIPNDVPLPAGLKGSAVNIEKGKSIETELATPNEDVVVKPDEIKVENKEAKTESVSKVKDALKPDNNVDENKEKEI